MFYFPKRILITAVVFLVPFYLNAATFVSGDILTDTTWTKAESPYVINNYLWLKVLAGVTLIDEPGVVVKFADHSFLDVYGTLKVLGTEDDRVYFTSLANDSVGGDTNGDGDATQPGTYHLWRVQLMENSGQHLLKNLEMSYSNDPLSIIRTVADLENIEIHD